MEADGLSITPPPSAVFNVNASDRAWVDELCTPQPVSTSLQPIRLTGAFRNVAKRHYMLASGWKGSDGETPFRKVYDAVKADPAWSTYEFLAGHDLMIDAPDELLELLLSKVL